MDTTEKLLAEIEEKRTNFKTESYPMSIGELSNLYTNTEILIRPEYQRLFRWSQGQKVKLIESILLGIPIPSIFVYQDKSGIWELVDGLQRISTILQFMGILKDSETLVLNGTKYLPSLEGFSWDNVDEKIRIPEAIKLAFKRSKLNFTIILSESDPRAKFEVFQRLNTGGSNASNQEIRNNIMIMMNPEIFKWFEDLSKNEHFTSTISLSDRLLEEQYHMELLLRYISLINYNYDTKKDVGDFLDDVNDKMLIDPNFAFEATKNKFDKVFELLDAAFGEKSFKKDFKGKFLESAFEAIAVGISASIENYDISQDVDLLIDKVGKMYSEDFYINNAGSGTNAKSRINKIIPAAKEYFRK